MISKIDWVSFTIKLDSAFVGASEAHTDYVLKIAAEAFPEPLRAALFDRKFGVERGRAPYSVRLADETGGLSVFYGGKQAHLLLECSGRECERLERMSSLLPLLDLVRTTLSRLDIATDMPVEALPSAFVAAGYSDRFKSHAHMRSETGETEYVGSRDSERYARVYRYFPPHPRAEWLRVEAVLKHENARECAARIVDSGLVGEVARLGNTFGWKHPAWRPDFITDEVASSWTPERRHGATVRWLITSVFPAMRRLVEDGTIPDLNEFLETNLFQVIEEE